MNRKDLTKSLFVAGKHCVKAAYLTSHTVDAKPTLTALERKTLVWGNAVGHVARLTFPGGLLIDTLDLDKALVATSEAVKKGVLRLYEAAFRFDDVLVRVDILSRETTESPWDFYEVKATTYHDCDKEQKAEYRNDIGIQVWVLQQLNIPLGRICLMHLNRECRYPELSDLFSFEDYSTEIISVLVDIKSDIAALRKTLTQKIEPPYLSETSVTSHEPAHSKCTVGDIFPS